MKKLLIVGFVLTCILFSCDDNDNDCPDGMDECKLKDGTTICVPKGSC